MKGDFDKSWLEMEFCETNSKRLPTTEVFLIFVDENESEANLYLYLKLIGF